MSDESSKATATAPTAARTETNPAISPGNCEPCEECGAPMDAQQRYCINCAARRGNGANPSSRYFAAMSKRARRPLTPAGARKPPATSRAAAVGFFALLPIAVALGVVVGRSGSGGEDNRALLEALRKQESAAVASSTGTEAEAGGTGQKSSKKGVKAKDKGKKAESAAEKKSVVAHTKNGTVHEVTHLDVSKQKEEEDTRKVEENPAQVGKNYIKAQQNLGDVTVIGGDGSAAPAPKGPEP